MKSATLNFATISLFLSILIFPAWMASPLQPTLDASSITGKVTDDATGNAIAFANVVILDSLGAVKMGATTDFNGKYELKPVAAGVYDIQFSVIGYKAELKKNVLVEKEKVTTLDVQLITEVMLQEVEVVEYRPVEIMRDATVAGSVIMKHEKLKGPAKRFRSVSSPSFGRKGGYNMSYSEDYNREGYDHIVENDFKEVKATPLSTLSIDVDAASYANVRRLLNQGNKVPADAVRVEEMINYFTYNYPNPVGEDPFSITTEVSDCPWNEDHQLVHIGIQGKRMEATQLPASNLVFLLDVSGSMNTYNKLPLLKNSFKLLVNELDEKDKVSIVVYAGAAGLVLKPTSGKHKDDILASIDLLSAGGSTAGGQGIELAYKIAQENFIRNGNNRVILATDGDFNMGVSSDGELVRLIEEKRKSGVFLTVLGFGTGNYQDAKMEKLSNAGNGNFAYIDNLLEAKKVLVSEIGATMFAIAKDVKIQVEFNPAKVESYKLIGYENRLLNDEDFNDDTKDAGELGAGHSVTALYEIVPAGKGGKATSKVDPLRYQETNLSNKGEEGGELLTVKFRYKPPNGNKSLLITRNLLDKHTPFSATSDDFRFSAAVATFGMLLRDSKYKKDATYSMVLNLAKEASGQDEHGYRAEFIRMVELSELQASK